MAKYDYLIIGGGMTAAYAVQGIREVDPNGMIGIIGAEPHRPYNRPPLSKKLWAGKSEDILWPNLPSDHLDLILDCHVKQIDPQNKQVQDEAGRAYDYGKLLIANGGSPRRLPFLPAETCYYRTLDDYRTVRSWMGKGARIGIIGGGFIGSEIAASLAENGEKVVMVFPEDQMGERIYPADLRQYLMDYYREKGVEIHPGFQLQNVDRQGNSFMLGSKDGKSIPVDHIIAGIGIRPNIELAQAAGIKISEPGEGGGILVDPYLRTSLTDIYAAGDIASFYSPALEKTTRVEHADNAKTMGRYAGLNMAGRETPYDHLPFFYSDMFDLGYEAVGELDPRSQVVSDWIEPYRQGVVYYLKENKVRGVLLWNTWDQVDAARAMIAEGQTYTPETIQGRLPEK
jgi:3-phenylpropionate/trans-cinnamate dioxygenase ferredoxin reductase component